MYNESLELLQKAVDILEKEGANLQEIYGALHIIMQRVNTKLAFGFAKNMVKEMENEK